MKSQKSEYELLILGGGPAGLSVSFYAKKTNIPFQLIEASNHLGGNCFTFNDNGYYYDSGAHRLHDKDSKATNDIKELLKSELKLINVPSQIYRDNNFIDFPLSPFNLFRFLGLLKSLKSIFQIIFYVNNKQPKENFKSLAYKRYGKIISDLFLIKYSEKLWGKPANELSVMVSGKRLKGLNLKSFIYETLGMKSKNVKHLDGAFYYPEFGIGTIFKKMGEYCGKENLKLNSKVTKISHRNGHVVSVSCNNQKEYFADRIVSSLPLNIFLKILDPLPPKEVMSIANSIKFRNLILIIFYLDKESVNGNGSMYFPSDEFLFTRIYEPKNRSKKMSPESKTSLVVEIPCFDSDEIWVKNNWKLVQKVKKNLIDCGFFKENELIGNNLRKLENAYPVLENDFETKIQPIFDYLSDFKNLILTGRNGLFEYTHIHDHMKNGRKIIQDLNKIKN